MLKEIKDSFAVIFRAFTEVVSRTVQKHYALILENHHYKLCGLYFPYPNTCLACQSGGLVPRDLSTGKGLL